MPKCVCLLSGGLDSATALAVAQRDGFQPIALTVLYGQRHGVEADAARRVAQSRGVRDHRFVRVELDAVGGSALTDDIDVPKDRTAVEMASGIPITYVPARNTVFLALALGLAETAGAQDIFIGVNAVDYSGYPDCRAEFLQQFERLANVATKKGVEGSVFRLHAPLIAMSKTDIVKTGLGLEVDYSLTHSCYDPDSQGRACGRCDSCAIRKRGFESLGLRDPALHHLD